MLRRVQPFNRIYKKKGYCYMKGNDYEAWIQYAHNDLSVAMREMERTVNPKLRP